MSSLDRGVSESDLHRWLDDQLEPGREKAVVAYLEEHPEEARRLAGYRRFGDLLHREFDPVLAEPIPEALRPSQRTRRAWPRRAAAALAWLAIGGALGWTMKPDPAVLGSGGVTELVRSAARAHAIYAVEVRHPVEVGADEEAHLTAWLSKRLGAPLRPPHLGKVGFDLVGGRLLPSESGPAAQFMYQDGGGRRLTLYVHQEIEATGTTAFRYEYADGIGMFYWIDGKLGYALSGEVPREELLRSARIVYRELNP